MTPDPNKCFNCAANDIAQGVFFVEGGKEGRRSAASSFRRSVDSGSGLRKLRKVVQADASGTSVRSVSFRLPTTTNYCTNEKNEIRIWLPKSTLFKTTRRLPLPSPTQQFHQSPFLR